MDDTPSRITPAAAFRLCDSYAALARNAVITRQSDRADVEFIL
jgi:hypothetical protein